MHLSWNSLVLVARHDDNLDVIVPDHLPEIHHSLRHWTLGSYVPLPPWVDALSIYTNHNDNKNVA